MHHFVTLAALVMPTHTGAEATQLLLRWVHFLAGVTWIGLLYFFNLINVPFMKQVDASMKPKIFQYLTLPTLNLFRWSSLLTVFVAMAGPRELASMQSQSLRTALAGLP